MRTDNANDKTIEKQTKIDNVFYCKLRTILSMTKTTKMILKFTIFFLQFMAKK